MPRLTASREQAELITPVPPMNRTFMLNASFCGASIIASNRAEGKLPSAPSDGAVWECILVEAVGRAAPAFCPS